MKLDQDQAETEDGSKKTLVQIISSVGGRLPSSTPNRTSSPIRSDQVPVVNIQQGLLQQSVVQTEQPILIPQPLQYPQITQLSQRVILEPPKLPSFTPTPLTALLRLHEPQVSPRNVQYPQILLPTIRKDAPLLSYNHPVVDQGFSSNYINVLGGQNTINLNMFINNNGRQAPTQPSYPTLNSLLRGWGGAQ
eukprot:TRINITY_DN14441_c0_g1_i3.p1 TRINITY_DN14441_c0_g1~~TRINITY_DN14441_c0_g1_i3.p1  ORF type:complete len:192 (+),score=24.35 TRINITY_DN14441_c0_g1_i3:436-1011(+)